MSCTPPTDWFFGQRERKQNQMHVPSFTAAAVNGYEDVLQPTRMVMDVSYWLNRTAEERFGRGRFCTINASVEESTLADRDGSLLEQDAFLRDAVGPGDVVVLSVGGNDIALRPTKATIVWMLALTRSPVWAIKAGVAPGFSYFVVRPPARELWTRPMIATRTVLTGSTASGEVLGGTAESIMRTPSDDRTPTVAPSPWRRRTCLARASRS